MGHQVIQMHSNRYPSNASRVRLEGTLLRGIKVSCFAPLLEKESPISNSFVDFIEELKAYFGDE